MTALGFELRTRFEGPRCTVDRRFPNPFPALQKPPVAAHGSRTSRRGREKGVEIRLDLGALSTHAALFLFQNISIASIENNVDRQSVLLEIFQEFHYSPGSVR